VIAAVVNPESRRQYPRRRATASPPTTAQQASIHREEPGRMPGPPPRYRASRRRTRWARARRAGQPPGPSRFLTCWSSRRFGRRLRLDTTQHGPSPDMIGVRRYLLW